MNILDFLKFPRVLKVWQYVKKLAARYTFPVLMTGLIIVNLYHYFPQVLPQDFIPVLDHVMLKLSGEQVEENVSFVVQENRGSGVNFDTDFYPYYGFLNTNEKEIYRQIYQNANNLCTSFIPCTTVTVEEAENAVEAVLNDHPELFWLETTHSCCYTKNRRCVKIVLTFNDTANDLKTAKTAFHKKASAIIDVAKNLESNYEKEKYVHDTLLSQITYDESSKYNQSAYSALMNGTSVCAGYSKAFQYIMRELGIPTYYCIGESEESHAWNIVKLDGEYYNVDLTWDDEAEWNYQFFNRAEDEFAATHTRLGTSLKLPACNGKTYEGPKYF